MVRDRWQDRGTALPCRALCFAVTHVCDVACTPLSHARPHDSGGQGRGSRWISDRLAQRCSRELRHPLFNVPFPTLHPRATLGSASHVWAPPPHLFANQLSAPPQATWTWEEPVSRASQISPPDTWATTGKLRPRRAGLRPVLPVWEGLCSGFQPQEPPRLRGCPPTLRLHGLGGVRLHVRVIFILMLIICKVHGASDTRWPRPSCTPRGPQDTGSRGSGRPQPRHEPQTWAAWGRPPAMPPMAGVGQVCRGRPHLRCLWGTGIG